MHASRVAKDDGCTDQPRIPQITLDWNAWLDAGTQFPLSTWHEDGVGGVTYVPPPAGSVWPQQDQIVDGLLTGVVDSHTHHPDGLAFPMGGVGRDEDPAGLEAAAVKCFPPAFLKRCTEFVLLQLKDLRLLCVDPALLVKLGRLDREHPGLVADLLRLLAECAEREEGRDDRADGKNNCGHGGELGRKEERHERTVH